MIAFPAFWSVAPHRLLGALATVALASYALLSYATLVGLGATLTLPGLAGFVLAIGMAIDANVLAEHEHTGAVLSCSALKRSYRDMLRGAVPALHFLHLALSQPQALERVKARTDHFYPPSLVASQFEALEDPSGEPGVLRLDATASLESLEAEGWAITFTRWSIGEEAAPRPIGLFDLHRTA